MKILKLKKKKRECGYYFAESLKNYSPCKTQAVTEAEQNFSVLRNCYTSFSSYNVKSAFFS